MTKIKKNAKNKNRFFFLHSSFLLELIIAAVAKKKKLIEKVSKKKLFFRLWLKSWQKIPRNNWFDVSNKYSLKDRWLSEVKTLKQKRKTKNLTGISTMITRLAAFTSKKQPKAFFILLISLKCFKKLLNSFYFLHFFFFTSL